MEANGHSPVLFGRGSWSWAVYGDHAGFLGGHGMVSARRACLRLDHVSSTVSTVASLCLSKQTPRHPINNDPPMQLQGRVFFCHTNLPRCTILYRICNQCLDKLCFIQMLGMSEHIWAITVHRIDISSWREVTCLCVSFYHCRFCPGKARGGGPAGDWQRTKVDMCFYFEPTGTEFWILEHLQWLIMLLFQQCTCGATDRL